MPSTSSSGSLSTTPSSPSSSPSASSGSSAIMPGHGPTPSTHTVTDLSSPTRSSTKSKRTSGLSAIVSFLSFGRKRNKARAASTGEMMFPVTAAAESSSTLQASLSQKTVPERDRRAFSIPQGKPQTKSSNTFPGPWPTPSTPSPTKAEAMDWRFPQLDSPQQVFGKPQKIINNITMTVVEPDTHLSPPSGSRSRAATLSAAVPVPPRHNHEWLQAPPPIVSPPFGSTYLEPNGYGRSSAHSDAPGGQLPSSAATFGMPSTTSLKLPTPDVEDRMSSIAVYEDHTRTPHGEYDDDDASIAYSQEWHGEPPPQGGVPASFTSSYFSMSPASAMTTTPLTSAFASFPPPLPRTRKSSAAGSISEKVVRRSPSRGPAQRMRKASSASISPAHTVREEDEPSTGQHQPSVRSQPSRPTLKSSGSLSRPSMSAFGVNKSLFQSEAASLTSSRAATEDARHPTPKPTPLVIPKSRSYGEGLRHPSPRSASDATPGGASGVTRSYTRAEKAKGKALPEVAEPSIRKLPPVPPLPSRSSTFPDPRGADERKPNAVRPLPPTGSPATTASSSTASTPYSSPSTGMTSAGSGPSPPRRLPTIPGGDPEQRRKVSAPRPLPNSKRSLPAIPLSHPSAGP